MLNRRNKKYKLTYHTKKIHGHTLHRIKALRDFGDVRKGDLGGWIESYHNLSQGGKSWVYDDAKVYGDAQILMNARVYDSAEVYDYACVWDNAMILDQANIFGNAKVCGDAMIYDNDMVYGYTYVYSHIQMYGNGWVCSQNKLHE